MSQIRSVVALSAALASVAPAIAHAQGIVLVTRETSNGRTSTNQMMMDRTHIRADTRENGEAVSLVFDAEAKVVRMIETDKKTYREMSQAEGQRLGGQANDAMAAMQAQLASLPPEQRAMVQQMMAGRGMAMPGAGGPAAPAKTEYRRTGTDKVGQWACTKYEGYRGAEKVSEVCAADAAALGLSVGDFDIARQLGEFLNRMMPGRGAMIPTFGTPDADGFSGFPVRRTTFRDGAVEMTSEVTEIRREAIPASQFAVPAGFRREAIGGRGG